MRLALFGTELEENLALRSLHAAAEQAGHQAQIFSFHDPDQVPAVISALLAWRPEVLGLSMVFTRNALEFVRFAAELRRRGFAGHITAGGPFATLHARLLLEDAPAIDSVLHGEGEEPIVDLLEHLHEPERVAGMTRRLSDGAIVTSAPRSPTLDLDARPNSTRPDALDRVLGLPLANMLGSRGCFAACSFCSIAAWNKKIGAPRFRLRRADRVAAEMAELFHRRGARLFNFHDDNFFLRTREETLGRFAALRHHLGEAGVGRIGIQVKSRPDTLDAEVVRALKELGCFRVFLGVESNSVKGLKALGRGIRRDQNHVAMKLLLDAGFHVTFNLLAFEPECTVADLRDNIAFIEQYPQVPLNIARTEVYGGTPLEKRLLAQGALAGSYFGYDYRIAAPAAQRVFEVFRVVFRERNFTGTGINLRAMAVDYELQVLRHFWPERVPRALHERVKAFIREVNVSNADLLRRACDFAETAPDDAATAAFAQALDDERRVLDAALFTEVDGLLRTLERLSRARPASGSTPGYVRGSSDTKSLLVLAAIAAAATVGIISLFGDNIRRLFGTSTELAGDVSDAKPRPGDAGEP